MNTKLTELKVVACTFTCISVFLFFVSFILVAPNYTNAASKNQKGLTDFEINKFSQNSILFYNPGECLDSDNSNGTCGNTAKEIYWSSLRKYTDDPVKIAGIVGNLANEGGMNPVAWEGYPSAGNGGIHSDGELEGGWDAYYNGNIDRTGVGAFQITSGLDSYLHYVTDNAPDLANYFKNSKEYSYNYMWSPGCSVDSAHPSYGDCLLEKIGTTEFYKLVEFELEYALGDNFKPTVTQEYFNTNFLTPSDASYWWAQNWEIGQDYQNPSQARLDSAEQAYDDLKDFSCSNSGSETCKKLGELRTKMWTEASQTDREYFMYVVEREDHSIAGVEGFMNQVISKHGTNGSLNDWLNHQCPAFGGGLSCKSSHTITNEEQDWINQALNGSNNIKFAIGNATGGSNVGAGKIVCVWDGTKCRDDVDYTKEDGKGVCSVYSPSAEFGECWGLEGEDSWADTMAKECGSDSSNSATSGSSSSNGASVASSSNNSNGSSNSSSSDITLIGDSISVASENELKEKFPNSFLSMVGSRHPISGGACSGDEGGLSVLRYIVQGRNQVLTQHADGSCETLSISSDSLKDNIVWELGTNENGASEATIKEAVQLVDDKNLYLVTPYNGDRITESEKIAQIYRNIANENDNVYIVDWAKAVKDNESTYITRSDNMAVHPTDEGKKLLASLINEAVNGGSGCTTYEGDYPEYLQWSDPWGSLPYSDGTYGNSACGASSMAMLATVATGQDIFPNDIGDFLEEQSKLGNIPGGASPYYDRTSVTVLDPIVGEHYNFEVINDSSSSIDETKTKFRDYLQKGYMIHFTGAGCYPGFQDGGQCSNGHVIGLFSIDNEDNVMQANSAWGGNQKASLDDMAKAKTWDVFTAIKGKSTSKNGCNNSVVCSNSNSNTVIMGNGLTREQAQKIADYYNSDEVDASNFIGNDIPSSCQKINCVSFSLWFVSAFTDASDEGATFGQLVGDGAYIASTGLPSIGWKNGNDPTPFSVFGGAGSSAWSHTGVVVGTADNGDALTIEAAYCVNGAQVQTRPLSYFAENVGILAYPGEHFTQDKSHLGNKSLNEIIGN